MLVLLILSSSTVQASGQIEIFSINKGEVVKVVSTSQEIQHEVEEILHQITDIYREFEPIPSRGYMIKVPLDPAVQIKNKWANHDVIQVILIFPEYENPHLMVFDRENRSYFFTLNRSVDSFLTKIDFIPNKQGANRNPFVY
jgi:hypothetical protein